MLTKEQILKEHETCCARMAEIKKKLNSTNSWWETQLLTMEANYLTDRVELLSDMLKAQMIHEVLKESV